MSTAINVVATIPAPSPIADPPIPAALAHLGLWLSAAEFASLIGRTPRRIQQMCQRGEVLDFRILTYKDDHGRWWICRPSCYETTKP